MKEFYLYSEKNVNRFLNKIFISADIRKISPATLKENAYTGFGKEVPQLAVDGFWRIAGEKVEKAYLLEKWVNSRLTN